MTFLPRRSVALLRWKLPQALLLLVCDQPTAVSHCVALWPKGDGWGGGGHFLSQNRIALNHRDGEMGLADGFSLPKWLTVKQYGERPGWGEDDPVWSERLGRDGWTVVSYPTGTKDDFGAKVWIEFAPPINWRKRNPKWPKRYSLEMSITGLKERDGPWYLTVTRAS